MSLIAKTIGQVAEEFEISTHTLRYYEKIGLLPRIAKSQSGRREYNDRDLERIRFIKRAQRMHFSLAEIRSLIQLDSAVEVDKPQVQDLVQEKLTEIEASLKDLKQLKLDLDGLLEACKGSTIDQDCPIIVGLKNE
jgi:DNA-binding transcriptional MerR regulator